jgi:hypothetical protein
MSPMYIPWACWMSLCVQTALTAAPPPRSSPPLFQPFAVQPDNMAVLTAGASFAPGNGPCCAFSALVAGAHPEIQVWNLRGPLSTRPGRVQIGASSLFLAGFGPSASTPLVELATLQAGDDRSCWELIDTDRLRPFPPALLEEGLIRDRKGIFNGDPEIEAYNQILILAHYTSAKAFAAGARHDLSYANLFNEPERLRGQVVHVDGRLVKLRRFDLPDEARGAGVGDLYESWIMTDNLGENPVCAVFTDLPTGLTIDNRRRLNIPVGFDGYYFKRYRYKSPDTKKANEFRDAPLLIGHTLTGQFGPNTADEGDAPDNWGQNLIWIFLGLVGGSVLVVVVMTSWFRYNDSRVRRRISATRNAGFVPPSSANGEDTFHDPRD